MATDGEASGASPARGVAHWWFLIALAVGLAVVTNAFYESWAVGDFATTRLAPQANANYRAAVASSSLAEAWAKYPGVWPPLYPTLLYAAAAVGVPLERVNQVLFYLTVAFTALLFRRYIPSLNLAAPISLFAVAVYQYKNLPSLFSEPLFVLLSLVCYGGLLHYQERPSWARLLGLTTACAAVCLTRYNGLLWVFPLCALGVLAGRGRRSERVGRAGLLAAVSLTPVGLWMLYQRAQTGFLTGMDRLGPRRIRFFLFLRGVDLRDPITDLKLALSTLCEDLLALPFPLLKVEIGQGLKLQIGQPLLLLIACLGLGIVGWLVWSLRPKPTEKRFENTTPRWSSAFRRPGPLAAMFFGVYFAEMVVIWTVSNPDPIQTRFVYPCYAFLLIWGFDAYAKLRNRNGAAVLRRGLQVGFCVLLALHIYRSAQPLLAGHA